MQSCEGVKMHSVPEGLRSEVSSPDVGRTWKRTWEGPPDSSCQRPCMPGGVRFGLELCDLGQELQEGC